MNIRSMLLRALVSALIVASAPLWALASTGSSGAILMQQPFGARPFALAQAYAALGNDSFGLVYNPAILSRLTQSEVATELTQSFGSTQLGYLGLSSPLSPDQAMGLSLAYLNSGKAALFDDTGLQTGSVTGQQDMLATLGYSHSMTLYDGKLHLGGSAKALRSVLGEESSAFAYAADLGGLYEWTWGRGRPSVALAIANLGPAAGYSGGLATGSARDPLPLTMRLGTGYVRDLFQADTLAVGLQIDRIFNEDALYESLGFEYNYRRLLSMRFGYRVGEQNGGLRLGLGFAFRSLSVDYAVGLMQALNNVQRISLNYRFAIPGIRYDVSTPPTGLETLTRRVKTAFMQKNFFDAASEIERIRSFFPDSTDMIRLNQQLQQEMEAMFAAGASGPRYHYVVAFKYYREGKLEDARDELAATVQADPANEEAHRYLDKIKKSLDDQQKQSRLEAEARTGKLFELASQAYEAKELSRAERIIDEILRLGPYQPAQSLKNKINADKNKPVTRPLPMSAPVKPVVTAQPTSQDAEQAEQLYYEALRYYAENDWEKAVKKLHQSLALDPRNKAYQNTLEGIEAEFRNRAKEKVRR